MRYALVRRDRPGREGRAKLQPAQLPIRAVSQADGYGGGLVKEGIDMSATSISAT